MSKPSNASTSSSGTAQAQSPTTEHKKNPAPATNSGKGTVSVLPGMCMAEECKKRAEKANFCMEHFDWFKEGLITKEGRRPTDFEKKFSDYSRRHKKSA